MTASQPVTASQPAIAARSAGALADRLTVVVLVYNARPRLDRLVERLQALRLPLIAVDNASRDGTADELERRGVEVIRLPDNVGAAGRNAGIFAARTPYVLCCDDDGWYDEEGLTDAVGLLDEHPALALVNARIVVDEPCHPDPISTEMAASPVPDRHGIPGAVLLSFMAGACMVRVEAFREVGGYHPRVFLGGEEETVALPLLRAGWAMRYLPSFVMHHHPSRAHAHTLRGLGLRNTLWTAWLHRPWTSALRWTAFTLADAPKNRSSLLGLLLALRGLPFVVRERAVVSPETDADLRLLDSRRFASRRRLLSRSEQVYVDPASWAST